MVCIHGAQILDLEFDQRGRELVAVAEIVRECVCYS